MFQVVFPHCATCFGRCYPGGATLITDGKNLFDGLVRLLATSSARELPKPVHNAEGKNISENGNLHVVENGVMPSTERTSSDNLEEKEKEPNNTTPEDDEEKIPNS